MSNVIISNDYSNAGLPNDGGTNNDSLWSLYAAVSDVKLTTINGSAYPPAAPSVANWSTIAATSNVNMATNSIANVSNINGAAYPPVVPNWATVLAWSDVDIANNSLLNVKNINGAAYPPAVANWSTIAATANVSMANHSIANVTTINGSVYPPAPTANWSTLPATSNVNLANYNMTSGGDSTFTNMVLSNAALVSIDVPGTVLQINAPGLWGTPIQTASILMNCNNAESQCYKLSGSNGTKTLAGYTDGHLQLMSTNTLAAQQTVIDITPQTASVESSVDITGNASVSNTLSVPTIANVTTITTENIVDVESITAVNSLVIDGDSSVIVNSATGGISINSTGGSVSLNAIGGGRININNDAWIGGQVFSNFASGSAIFGTLSLDGASPAQGQFYTTSVNMNSLIFLTPQYAPTSTITATPKVVAINAGSDFTIEAGNGDNAHVCFFIVNPNP